MTDAPDAPPIGNLSVLDSWRILLKPVPSRRATSYAGLLAIIGLFNLSAIAALVAVTVPDPMLAMIATLLHTTFIPGVLLAFALVPSDEVDLFEWVALALGFGFLVLVLGGLILALLPGRFAPMNVAMWTFTVTIGIGVFAFRRGMTWTVPALGTRAERIGVVVLILLAAALRLPGLGYSEFQGDETEVILRATGVVQDLPDALFYHGKGPGEIVTVAVNYGLIGNLSEGAARLPFALAGIAGVLAFYVVARRLLRMVGASSGASLAGAMTAALLLAVNGYFVAFSRITQYQTLVLVLGMLGLWCALRWSLAGRPSQVDDVSEANKVSGNWPVLAGIFVATAALAHYDALFFLPPLGLAALWRLGWRGFLDYDELQPWIRAAAAGAIVLALFFAPYLDSPLFALATDRIGDRVGAGFPRNNVLSIVASATLYLGTVFPILVGVTIVGGLASLLRPAARSGGPSSRVWLLALLWAVVPLLFYAFVARKPGTHVHVATSGMLLLAGCGAASIWAACRAPIPRYALAGVLGIGIAAVASYLMPIYLQTTAEIVRENRVLNLPLTWRPPGGLPTKERFGFPYEAGWKAAGALFADGTLAGSYDSNEQPQVTYWYTRGTWRCSADPRYYLIAENVQDEIETPRRTISSDYHQIGTVTVAGQPKLRVYERGPAAASGGARPTTWPAEQLTPQFDEHVSTPTFDPGAWARGVVSRSGTRLSESFGQDIDLLGYDVFAERPQPGGVVRVDLFWLPRVTSAQRHRIDVQLGQEPRIGDGGGPACDKTGDDKDWKANRPFVQRVSIPIAASASPGSYPLLVGVSRLGNNGGPLKASGAAGAATGLVEIGTVEVRTGR